MLFVRSDALRRVLADIVRNGDLAMKFVGKRTVRALENDTLRYYATVRCLEIISEASRRLPDSFKEEHPLIAWSQIARAGNVYRHHYDVLNAELVRDTVANELPALLHVARAHLEKMASSVPD